MRLQRGLKSLLTQTTCKFAVPQKGLFAIRSQGLLRKGDSRYLCKTHSLGLKHPSSDPTPRRGPCHHCYQELTATLACLKAAQDSLQARALWTLVHPGQSRPLLPARKVFNTSCTHLQVPLVRSKLEFQRDGGYVLGPGAPALQLVLTQGPGLSLGSAPETQLRGDNHKGA